MNTRQINVRVAIAILCVCVILITVFVILHNRPPPEPTVTYLLPDSRTKPKTETHQPKAQVSPKVREVIPNKVESQATDVTDETLQSEPEVQDSNFEDEVLKMFSEVEQDEKEKTEQPKSAFGFGTFPEIPSDYPDTPVWQQDDYPNGDGTFGRDFVRSMELMERVMIKLWSQGNRVNAGSLRDGIILPHYPNSVYLQWDYLDEPDGTQTRYVSGVISGPDVPSSVHDTIMDDGVIPSGITVLDVESEGIDPYSFLNLNQ